MGVTFCVTHNAAKSIPSRDLPKKKPGPCGPGCSLADKVGNHLPEGNSWLHRDRHLGGTAIVCLQRNWSMCLIAQANNADGRMSAMHDSASTS